MRIHRAVAVLLVFIAVGFVFVFSAGSALAAEHFITTVGFTFSPSFLEIENGDTVTWSNGGGGHNVSSTDDGGFRCADGCDDADGNGAVSFDSWEFSRVFISEGTIDYQCDAHFNFGMTGTIVVPEPSSTQLACAALISLGLLARRRG